MGQVPMQKSGETQGGTCFYCIKVYCACFRSVGQNTFISYSKSLDERGLQLHIQTVKVSIKFIIDRGGNRSVKLDWEKIEDGGGGTPKSRSPGRMREFVWGVGRG
jgi:hypothetical protein